MIGCSQAHYFHRNDIKVVANYRPWLSLRLYQDTTNFAIIFAKKQRTFTSYTLDTVVVCIKNSFFSLLKLVMEQATSFVASLVLNFKRESQNFAGSSSRISITEWNRKKMYTIKFTLYLKVLFNSIFVNCVRKTTSAAARVKRAVFSHLTQLFSSLLCIITYNSYFSRSPCR